MIIPIGKDETYVFAMGHRVELERGGVAEVKRRCLETLCHLDNPPDRVEFQRLWEVPATSHESGERPATRAEEPRAAGGKRRR